MNVRTGKRLVLIAAAFVVVAAGLNIWNAWGPGGKGWTDLTDVLPFGVFAVLLATMWSRFAKLEAEHGPDYTPPQPPFARTVILIAAGVAVALAAVAVVLVLKKG